MKFSLPPSEIDSKCKHFTIFCVKGKKETMGILIPAPPKEAWDVGSLLNLLALCF